MTHDLDGDEASATSPLRIARRTVVAGAAWAVPAIALTTSSPAFAGSGPTLSLTTPDMTVTAGGSVTLTATARSGGAPATGQAVSLVAPGGWSFSPSAPTTDGAGQATSTLSGSDVSVRPGTSISVSGTTSGASSSAGLTVRGANAFALGLNVWNLGGTDNSATELTSPTRLQRVFTSPIAAISASPAHALALLEDGTVWSIGANSRGELGDSTTTARSTWARVPGISGATAVVAIGSSTGPGGSSGEKASSGSSFVLAGGLVYAWGDNTSQILGLGTTAATVSTPTPIPGLASVTSLSVSVFNGFAVSGGEVYAWGDNGWGQLGDGTTTSHPTPVKLTGLSGVSAVWTSRSAATFAVSGGNLWSWGLRDFGQLGRDSSVSNTIPGPVPGISGVTALSASEGAVLAIASIKPWGWGRNDSGQLGLGTTKDVSTPTQITKISVPSALVTTDQSSFAITGSSVWAWGLNSQGQLGTGDTKSRSSPVTISVGSSVNRLFGAASNDARGGTVFFVG